MTSNKIQKKLAQHSLWLEGNGGKQFSLGIGENLWSADLQGADLRDADLSGADLQGADLREADLEGANLEGADLREADFDGADLREANLQDADLRDANLSGANLFDADFSGADLRNANLLGASLKGVEMRGAKMSAYRKVEWNDGQRGRINQNPSEDMDPIGSNEGFRTDLYRGMSAAARKHGFDKIDAVDKAISEALDKIGRAVRIKNKVSSWRNNV